MNDRYYRLNNVTRRETQKREIGWVLKIEEY